MIVKPFDLALADYMTFRQKANGYLMKPVPGDWAALTAEEQLLEPMYARAGEWVALGAEYYLQAKSDATEKWIMEQGRAVSTATDAAKAQSYKEEWMRTDSLMTYEAVKSRKWTVSHILERVKP